ncbi:MAG: hypothetical protein FWB74_05480 [Defluviitaleaceae bacterium]|nr:hypothetical protein [Defluviitaleaceae bacterium]
MKFNLRAILGTAAVAVVLAATGCGSLANNAGGLERDVVTRDGVVREVNEGGRGLRHSNHRYGRRMGNRYRVGARRGINRENVANRYLRQDDLTLNNGRILGDGVNAGRTNAVHNYGRNVMHNNNVVDVVGSDGINRQHTGSSYQNTYNRANGLNTPYSVNRTRVAGSNTGVIGDNTVLSTS